MRCVPVSAGHEYQKLFPAKPWTGTPPNCSTRFADALTHQRVVACMESLPPEQKLAIELAYFSGLTHAEISEKTGTPLGTVKSRLRLGLLRLRTDFGIPAQEAL